MEQAVDIFKAAIQKLEDLRAAGVEHLPKLPEVASRPDSFVQSRGRQMAKRSPQETGTKRQVRSSKHGTPETVAGSPERRKLVVRQPMPTDPNDEKLVALRQVAEKVAKCKRCPELVANRTQTVFGVGNPYTRLVFLGEAPGADEDRQGEPFVGRAGQLLTDIIKKGMGIEREDVYILNVLKCRPPNNRTPTTTEAVACREYLDAQLEIIRPEFICCLGAVAGQCLLDTKMSITRLRGKVLEYEGIKVICTFHPAYLLRNPGAKREAWQDIQLLMKEMGLPLPTRSK